MHASTFVTFSANIFVELFVETKHETFMCGVGLFLKSAWVVLNGQIGAIYLSIHKTKATPKIEGHSRTVKMPSIAKIYLRTRQKRGVAKVRPFEAVAVSC